MACKSCGCPFPQESSEAPKLHGAIWECGACQDSKREILISELKEKARLKALEREQRELVKRQQKEDARLRREHEMLQRREVKELQKTEAKQLRVTQAMLSGNKLPTDSTEDNQDGSRKIKVSLVSNLKRATNINLARNPRR